MLKRNPGALMRQDFLHRLGLSVRLLQIDRFNAAGQVTIVGLLEHKTIDLHYVTVVRMPPVGCDWSFDDSAEIVADKQTCLDYIAWLKKGKSPAEFRPPSSNGASG